MKFKELKSVINRYEGRHDWLAIVIGLGANTMIEAESPVLDGLDDYEVEWICPSTFGENTVTDRDEPCIEIHLKEPKGNEKEGNLADES